MSKQAFIVIECITYKYVVSKCRVGLIFNPNFYLRQLLVFFVHLSVFFICYLFCFIVSILIFLCESSTSMKSGQSFKKALLSSKNNECCVFIISRYSYTLYCFLINSLVIFKVGRGFLMTLLSFLSFPIFKCSMTFLKSKRILRNYQNHVWLERFWAL